MKLHVRAWGEGERVVVLIHGTATDSRTWHRVAPRIASSGHRVVAVDLRGHGLSPRGDYSLRALADDLVEALPSRPEVVLGHSMGGALLALAVEALRPQRAVYAEPYWNVRAVTAPPAMDGFQRFKRMTAEQIASHNPRWSADDVQAELAARACWDPRSLADLLKYDMPAPPTRRDGSDVVLLAERPMVPLDVDALRENGYEVTTIPNAGHNLYHDNLPCFLDALTPVLRAL
ncbi:alpha/beta fold hydrolase [Actinomadura barringtoniae]|uniref:Alpha/beta fold hydrolase n=1 Tax=Actinomadura barringtoniae TaxID=1427535 RepID=A0A939T967_9ACTN|nr:alpha/beta hydrolase [Actinomadura barringtoniae]MBO2451057.1 alpha/beta fold hydrolase [Actinomadura barringtoniae]